MSTAQKIAVAFALIAVAGFLAYTAARDGGFRLPVREMRPVLDASPVSSASATPSPSGTVVPTDTNAPAPSAPAQATANPVAVTEAGVILQAMNAERVAVGSAPLIADAGLTALAQSHADDMVKRGYFSHTDPDGVTFEQRITAAKAPGTLHAENLGLTTQAAVEVVAGWMNSEGHRINMLNDQYRQAGIGVAYGPWQGFSAVFVVAVFGTAK